MYDTTTCIRVVENFFASNAWWSTAWFWTLKASRWKIQKHSEIIGLTMQCCIRLQVNKQEKTNCRNIKLNKKLVRDIVEQKNLE